MFGPSPVRREQPSSRLFPAVRRERRRFSRGARGRANIVFVAKNGHFRTRSVSRWLGRFFGTTFSSGRIANVGRSPVRVGVGRFFGTTFSSGRIANVGRSPVRVGVSRFFETTFSSERIANVGRSPVRVGVSRFFETNVTKFAGKTIETRRFRQPPDTKESFPPKRAAEHPSCPASRCGPKTRSLLRRRTTRSEWRHVGGGGFEGATGSSFRGRPQRLVGRAAVRCPVGDLFRQPATTPRLRGKSAAAGASSSSFCGRCCCGGRCGRFLRRGQRGPSGSALRSIPQWAGHSELASKANDEVGMAACRQRRFRRSGGALLLDPAASGFPVCSGGRMRPCPERISQEETARRCAGVCRASSRVLPSDSGGKVGRAKNFR